MLALQASRIAVRKFGLQTSRHHSTNVVCIDSRRGSVRLASERASVRLMARPSLALFSLQAPAKVQVAQRRQVVVCASVQQQEEAVPRRAALGLLAAAGEASVKSKGGM